jgi:hypothetical protein
LAEGRDVPALAPFFGQSGTTVPIASGAKLLCEVFMSELGH